MGQTNNNEKERLLMRLKNQAGKLTTEAAEAKEQVLVSKLEELAKVEELIEKFDQKKASVRASKRTVIILLLITLIIISILLFARVSVTEINLTVTVSKINFRSSRQQVVSNPFQLSALGVSGLRNIEFPELRISDDQSLSYNNGPATALRLSKSNNVGSITLSPLLLQPMAVISVFPLSEESLEYKITLKDSMMSLKADVHGMIEIRQAGIPPSNSDFLIPKAFFMHSGSEEVDITIAPLNISENIFRQQIFIDSLSFFNIDEFANEESTMLEESSGIISGSLFFESLGGVEHSLHAAEELRIGKLKGFISKLEIKKDQLSFTFHGMVRRMSTGGKENRISLMPTYLEWLKAKHSLSLLWGTSIYFFGILLGISRWWKFKN